MKATAAVLIENHENPKNKGWKNISGFAAAKLHKGLIGREALVLKRPRSLNFNDPSFIYF